jgi:acyl-CoA hydrolase
MLRTIVIAALAVGCAAAETVIPKTAVQVEPGVYKQTEASGKTYTFRKTPFGVVKSLDEEKPAKPVPETAPAAKPASTPTPFGDVKAAPQTENVKVTEHGDVLEFERASPFGSYKWKAKKSELKSSEREAWERSRKQDTASGSKASGPKE